MVRDQTPGVLVLVVGPSGTGKDTLIDYARARLGSRPDFEFVRRAITRPASIGEDHEPLLEGQFRERAVEGGFALHWQAHGLFYGLPAAINGRLDEGAVVIANGSRGIIEEARGRYRALLIVHVTAPLDVLARRLATRAREDESLLRQRLARSSLLVVEGDDVLEIDNSGLPEAAGERLVEALLAQSRNRLSEDQDAQCHVGSLSHTAGELPVEDR